MTCNIRQTEDLESVAELDRVCFPTDYPEDFSQQTCWLAHVGGELVGFTAMSLEPKYSDMTPVPHITRMGVIPAYRGSRLQRRLANVCIREATNLGFEALYTYVSVYNVSSLRSLIHSGFLPYACSEGWMQLGRWTKHRPLESRHAKYWNEDRNRI